MRLAISNDPETGSIRFQDHAPVQSYLESLGATDYEVKHHKKQHKGKNMEPNRISLEERERITGASANLFKARHPEYYPSQANSDKLVSFIENQLGMSIVDFPYPLQVENFEAAYFAILESGGWFYSRPIEPEVEDSEVTRERLAQQQVRDQYDAQQAAAKMQRDRTMDIKALGAEVSRQNADLRQQRDLNQLPVRQPGLESRSLATVTFGVKATARANVALENPSLDRNGPEFARLYAAELARLRG